MKTLTRFWSEVEILGRDRGLPDEPWVLCRYTGYVDGGESFDHDLAGTVRWINLQDLRISDYGSLLDLPIQEYDREEKL